jgi:serine/threonine-protein kinase
MGEVYRSRDTKLNRDVALKILPGSFTHDPERLARFRREAQVLAALNHPYIGAIYGLDEANGEQFLVLELVDGESLDKKIARGPIPVDEALTMARQIAEALEAAHEKAIIHRDLKPANIAVTRDGQVKVLDFGLAKATDVASGTSGELANSPTITSPAMMTGVGVILGTAAYMAPEQARGRAVDKRSDIWSFGCVLIEMLTGRRAFDGEDISTTLAAVLKTEPVWSALPATVPFSLRRLLSRCLQKDPKTRLRDIGEARIAIDDILSGALVESAPSAPGRRAPWWRRAAVPGAVALTASLASAAIVWFVAQSTLAQPHVWRFQIAPPSTAALTLSGLSRYVALTPNGSHLIYVGANGTTLFVRALDGLEATPLVRGTALRDPFVSPDGRWVGFFEGPQTLKKVAIEGGPVSLVARLDNFENGATWATDDAIIFATSSSTTGLQRVSADGGTPTVLTRPDRAHGEANHAWPEALPGGQAVLFTVTATSGGLDAASLAVFDLRHDRPTILLRGGSDAHYVPNGHLVYAAGGTLRAVGFDPKSLTIGATTTAVVPGVLTTSLGAAEASVAADGTLVYVGGQAGSGAAPTLVWIDRQGRETPISAPPHPYAYPRLSPDGTRVAITVQGRIDRATNVWLWDLAHGTLTPVTSDPALNTSPVWRDRRRVVFASNRTGPFNLFSQAADNTGTVDHLFDSPNVQFPTDVSPDGRVIVTELSQKTGQDVRALPLDGTGNAQALIHTTADERNGVVSPDGRWLAYEANDSGRFEIYVNPFQDVNSGRWPVSTSGGTQPLWARSGQELFYVAPDGTLMRVAVTAGPSWTASTPTKVLEGLRVLANGGNFPRNYDITADGQRFLMLKAVVSDAPPEIVVIKHFDEELKRLVPVK